MPAAWTTPRNWTTGELVTAAIGNSAWRDNFMYLKDSPVFDGNVTVTGTTLLTGVATLTAAPVFSSATASQAVFTNGSKALVSNAITGTGNVVMSASPTLTGTIAGAAMTLSGTLGVTGATTLSSATYTTNLTSTTALATPGALSATQATAFASTVSGAAIMGFGTTNDVALMNRAGTVVLGIGPNTTTVNMTGLLTVSGFGTSSFSAGGTGANILKVANTTAGTTNSALVLLGNDLGDVAALRMFSSTFTTSGPNVADSLKLDNSSSGGLSIAASNATGAIRFYSGGTTERMTLSSAGLLTVSGSGTSTFTGGVNSSHGVQVTNTTNGTNSRAALTLTNGSSNGYLWQSSTSNTESGGVFANSLIVLGEAAGGLQLRASNASGVIKFYSGGTTNYMTLSTLGQLQVTNGAGAYILTDQNSYVGLTIKTTSNVATGGFASFLNAAGSEQGSIRATNSTTTAYNTSSDQRIKRSHGRFTDVEALRQVVIHDAEFVENGARYPMVFAQEAYQWVPEAITPGSDGDDMSRLWSADYGKFTPRLIVGWQQHDATITQLAARIAALETKDH